MRLRFLHIICILVLASGLYAQDNGVMSFYLPARNSLTFNRYALSPTFSFVREEDKILSFTNKREWVGFNDSPVTYMFSYSGRLNERSGAGISLFQRNYGVLTTFGGLLNYAYNVPISNDNNLTFGANLVVYQSGLNSGSVVTNFPDPSLDNIPSNTLMTFNPSINYGTRFLDFGLTLRNYTLYNFSSSNLIEDDPERSVQAHFMYTGFMSSSGFFDDSKFSTLVRSEFKDSDVVLSGLIMLTVPKGIWAQAGYNSQYGISAGLGINLYKGLAIEYNYENGATNPINFGSSHEFTLAYRFKNKQGYRYSDDMEMSSLINQKRRKTVNKTDEATRARIAARAEARRLQAQEDTQLVAANTVTKEEPEVKTEIKASTTSISNEPKTSAEIKAERIEAKQKAKERAEELRAKRLEEAENKRLAFLKANENRRRKAAMAVLAEAQAEEKLIAERKEQQTVRKLSEEKAARLAEAKAEQEMVRLANLKANEEQRRRDALAVMAAIELEESGQEANVEVVTDNSIDKDTEASRMIEEERKRQEAIAAAQKEQQKLEAQKAEEQARLLAEQQAAEEAQRLAEQKAAEEAQRLAEEKAAEEARRLAEQQAAEEAQRLAEQKAAQEAQRLAEERAAEEARRLAEQQAAEEAQRLAEQQAAEEAQRLADERAAEEARRLAEQQAAEEAQRLAEQQAAEEAQRLAELKANEDKRRMAALAILEEAEKEEQAKAQMEEAKSNDPLAQSINEVTEASNQLKIEQDALLSDLEQTVKDRKQDLADMKEENDLSEQGIYKAPKPFKSISEQNAQLEELKNNLDKTIAAQDKRLEKLQKLYKQRKSKYPSDEDEMNMIYLDEILIIQNSQKRAKEARSALLLELQGIKTAIEIERKRRIKRAAYDSQEDRYAKDMSDLKRLKETTEVDDSANVNFDYGESSSGTIKILKDVKHAENGYYVVMAVHSDKKKRDEFVVAALKNGASDINFFYDVNTSKYYIYSKKYNSLADANNAIADGSGKRYENNASMIKIENKTMK